MLSRWVPMPCLFLVMEDVRPFIHSFASCQRVAPSATKSTHASTHAHRHGQVWAASCTCVARLKKKSRRSQTHAYRLGHQDPGKQHTGTLSKGGWWARESEACRTQFLTHKPWHVPGMRMNKVGREAGLTLSHQVSYCVGTRRAYRES